MAKSENLKIFYGPRRGKPAMQKGLRRAPFRPVRPAGQNVYASCTMPLNPSRSPA